MKGQFYENVQQTNTMESLLMSEAPKDGKHVEYVFYENGQKEGEVHFKNGKLDGLWTEWDEDGKKTREIQYKDNKEVSSKEF